MPASYSDYLFLPGGGARVGAWVQLTNNESGTNYRSVSATDGNGMFTFIPEPTPGQYTVKIAAISLPLGDAGWVATGNVAYNIAYTAGDDIVMHSGTSKSSGPYTNILADGITPTPAGVAWGQLWDYGGVNGYSVMAAGAKMDGVTDDTAALNRAYAACGANGGMVSYGYGNPIVSSTVSVGANIISRGIGWGTVITGAAAIGSGNPIFGIVRSGVRDISGSVGGVGFEHLYIDGGGTGNGLWGIACVKYAVDGTHPSTRNNWLTGVKIRRCGVGLRLVFDQGIRCSSVAFHENTTGLYASDDAQLGAFEQCDFRGNVTGTILESSNLIATDITPDQLYGFVFTRCHWEVNTGKGLVIDGTSWSTWIGCKWEQNHDDAVTQQQVNGAFSPIGNAFLNCLWNGSPSFPATLQFNATAGSRLQFYGGWFNPGSTAGVSIGATVVGCVAYGTELGSAVSDTGSNLSRIHDQSAATTAGAVQLRVPDAGSQQTTTSIDVLGSDGGGTRNVYIRFQNRARFGFFGNSSQILVDDAGSQKDFSYFGHDGTAYAERIRMGRKGDLSIGGAPSNGGGVLVVFIKNATTVPVSNPTGGGILYVDAGALKYRGSSGTVTPIAPA